MIDHLLNEVATHKRRATSVDDGMGGQTGGGTTTLGQLMVRVVVESDDEQLRADREQGVIRTKVYASAGADVIRGDVLVIRDENFEVEVSSHPSERDAYLRAQCILTRAAAI